MIDLFLLIVTIANCILFILIMNWCKRIELFYDATNSYLKSVHNSYEHTEEVYKIITEQYDEVAKLMGWRDKDD